MGNKYVKIGGLGTFGVDKRQRVVKIYNLVVLGTQTTYANISVFGAKCYVRVWFSFIYVFRYWHILCS
jgi:hypothetical protein